MKKIFSIDKLMLILALISHLSLALDEAAEEELEMEGEMLSEFEEKASVSLADRLALGGFFSSTYRLGLGKYGDQTNSFDNCIFALTLDFKINDALFLRSEIINQTWYYLDYHLEEFFNLRLGKIIIPFGEEHSYEKLPGQIVPLFWTEPGVLVFGSFYLPAEIQLNYSLGTTNGLRQASSATTKEKEIVFKVDATTGATPKVDLKDNNQNKSLTFRVEVIPLLGLNIVGSGYLCRWDNLEKNRIFLTQAGLSYGVNLGWLGDWFSKVSYSQAKIEHPEGNFKQKGYYLQIMNRLFEKFALSFIYGEYDSNDTIVTGEDLHNTILRFEYLPREELIFRLEHEWNMEAINEIKNDWLKISVLVEY